MVICPEDDVVGCMVRGFHLSLHVTVDLSHTQTKQAFVIYATWLLCSYKSRKVCLYFGFTASDDCFFSLLELQVH